jgi:hypothetical protein
MTRFPRARGAAVAAGVGVGTSGALASVLLLGPVAAAALLGIVFALVWPLAAVIKHLADEAVSQSSASIAGYAAGAVLCLPGVVRLITWGAAGLSIVFLVAAAFAGLDLVVASRRERQNRRFLRKLGTSLQRSEEPSRGAEAALHLDPDDELRDENLIASLRCPLSIEELCAVWSETSATLAADAGLRDRQAEFERRNPTGFHQWLEAGAPADAGAYFLSRPGQDPDPA